MHFYVKQNSEAGRRNKIIIHCKNIYNTFQLYVIFNVRVIVLYHLKYVLIPIGFVLRQYSGWAPNSKDMYQKIPIQFIVQSRYETVVKFLRSEMVDPAQEQ